MCHVFWIFRKGRITFDFRGLMPEGSSKHRARVHVQHAEKAKRVALVSNLEGWVEVLTGRKLFEKFTVLHHLWTNLSGFTIISVVLKYLTYIIITCHFPLYPFSSIMFCCLRTHCITMACSNFLEMFSKYSWGFFFSSFKKKNLSLNIRQRCLHELKMDI